MLLNLLLGPLLSQVPETSCHKIALSVTNQESTASGDQLVILMANEPVSLRVFPPPPANDNCGSAATLVANSGCSNGTFSGATTQSGENTATSGHCGTSNFTMTVWYRFVAVSANMWVQTNITGLSGSGAGYYPARFTSVVYNDSTCQPALANKISCANMNTQGTGDGIVTNNLTGLSIGKTYLVQLGYNNGNGSQDPNFCIRLGNQYSPPCNTCAANCGQACGFPSTPTVAQVTASCPNYPYLPYIEGSQSSTRCHSFIANNSNVAFQVIVNSTCGAGNVSNFSWSLYNSTCGAAIQSGTLASMNFTGLVPGQLYVFCYSFTVPAGCYHTTHYPYFVGAQQLPVTLLTFQATLVDDDKALIRWITASEINNNYFELKRSGDGRQFNTICQMPGAGTSTSVHEYEFTDHLPSGSAYFYRLDQTDFNGELTSFHTIVLRPENKNQIRIQPNPVHEDMTISFNREFSTPVGFCLLNQFGGRVFEMRYSPSGEDMQVTLPVEHLPKGIYTLVISSVNDIRVERIVKL